MHILPAITLAITAKNDIKTATIERERFVATMPNETSALSGLLDGLNNSAFGFRLDLNL